MGYERCKKCGEWEIYPAINAEGKLIWYCDNCGHVQRETSEKVL